MDMLDSLYSKKRAMVEQELEAIVPRIAEPKEVYALIWDFLDRGGKRFRPLLCLTAARAVAAARKDEGKAVKAALPAAAAIELFHNFTLIHDDIEDSSELRRGKPCLHVEHGLPLAINAGDGLFMMVIKAMLRIPPKMREAPQRWLTTAFTSVLEGQAIELSWHKRKVFNLAEKDYEKMAGGKTAALIEASTRTGAYLAGGTQQEVEALAKYGYLLGLSFQVQDDVLNLTGEVKDYQKEIGGDIREGKRTLISIHALSHLSPQDAAKLKSILSSGNAGAEEIKWAIEKMSSCGSIEYATSSAKGMISEAMDCLSALPESDAKKELIGIAQYMVQRKR